MTTRRNDSAADDYVMWHQKEPQESFRVDVNFPKIVRVLGVADCITYASDKWEDDGDFHDYVHEFDSGPLIYSKEGQGDEFAIDVEGDRELPLLAYVKELIMLPVGGGAKKYLRFRSPPALCCTSDRKMLIIFTKKYGSLIVDGGKMHITERGIHR